MTSARIVAVSIHDVPGDEWDRLPWPEKRDGVFRWKSFEGSDGCRVTFFREDGPEVSP